MTVSFGNAAHVATVWVPQLAPHTATIISTLVAMAAIALILTGVAALFAVFCLEKTFTWARAALTLVVTIGLTFACAGGLQHISGTNDVHGAMPTTSRSLALASAKKAASPKGAWTPKARETRANGHTVQQGWSKDDLRAISSAVAASRGYQLGYQGAPAVIDSRPLTQTQIGQHGTSFVDHGTKVRCVVSLKNVVKNNVGQPVSARLSAVRCAPASAPPAKTS